MTGPKGNSEICFPRISMFPETKSRETLRFEGNKIHFSPRDQSLYSKTKQKQNLKTELRFRRSRATAVNISRATVNCFPFDVMVFAMLSAHGIWQETVSLLDVMWPWTTNEWARCSRKNASYITIKVMLHTAETEGVKGIVRNLNSCLKQCALLSRHSWPFQVKLEYIVQN